MENKTPEPGYADLAQFLVTTSNHREVLKQGMMGKTIFLW